MADEKTEEKTDEVVEGEAVAGSTALDAPKKDILLLENLMPERSAVVGLWSITDEEMENWEMEAFVSSAMVARQVQDFSNWIIGKFARGVSKKYGEDSLGEFAKEVGVPRGSVQAYRWVAEKFKDCEDTDLTIMPFTAYLVVAKLDNPLDWILKASNENWSVEKLKYEVDVFLGKALPEGEKKSSDKPKIIECEMCGKYRIVNTNQICRCDEPTANKPVDETDEDLGDALAEEPEEGAKEEETSQAN